MKVENSKSNLPLKKQVLIQNFGKKKGCDSKVQTALIGTYIYSTVK